MKKVGWPFNQVYHTIWRSKRLRALKSSDDRLLLFWYLTSEHQNSLGFYRCPDHWPAGDLQWDVARVSESRLRLQEVGLIHYDDETEEVYVDQVLRFAVKPSAQVFGGYRRQVEEIESDRLRLEVVGPALLEAEQRWSQEKPAKTAPSNEPQSQSITPQLQASLDRNRRGY